MLINITKAEAFTPDRQLYIELAKIEPQGTQKTWTVELHMSAWLNKNRVVTEDEEEPMDNGRTVLILQFDAGPEEPQFHGHDYT